MIRSWRNAASRKVWDNRRPNRFAGLDMERAVVLLDMLDAADSLEPMAQLRSVGLHALNALLLALSAQPHEQRRHILHQMRRTMTEGPTGAIAKIGGSRSHPENPPRGSERRLT